MLKFTLILFNLVIIYAGNSYAGVKLDSKDTTVKIEVTKSLEKTSTASLLTKRTLINRKPISAKIKYVNNRWHELYGTLNKKHVYLLVEKTDDHQVSGYLFDGKGNEKYIYGQWFKGYLQVYDQSNNNFTIIIND